MVTAVRSEAVTDLTALSTDAQNLIAASDPTQTPPPSPPPIDFAPYVATLWGPQVAVALGVAATSSSLATGMRLAQSLSLQAQSALSPTPALSPSAHAPHVRSGPIPRRASRPSSRLFARVKTAAADVTGAAAQILAAAALAKVAVAAAPPHPPPGAPPLPNPNAAAVYINLPHVDISNDLQIIPDITSSSPQLTIDKTGTLPPGVTGATLNTSGVTPEANDPTAFGFNASTSRATGPALHPGSDVAIVGAATT